MRLLLLAFAMLFAPALTFFEKNRQRWPLRSDGQWNTQGQWRRTRRGGYTVAQFTLHTFEGGTLGKRVLVGATFLLGRTTPGSYHWLLDALRGHLRLAPWSAETWHSIPTNNWAASASALMNAADWRKLNAAKPGSLLHTYRQNIIYGFAFAAADFSAWLIAQGRDPVPKRILTTAQALRKEPGFVFHRTTDPARRRDPADPAAEFPWGEFFTEYDRLLAELTGTTTTPVQEDDDMAKAIEFSSKGADEKDHLYVAFPNAREYEYIESAGARNDYKNVLTRQGFIYEVWTNSRGTSNVGNPDVFGRYVGPESVRPAAAKRRD